MNSIIPFEAKKSDKVPIKNFILISLLEYFCESKGIDKQNIILSELEKFGILDKKSIKKYNKSHGEKILNVLASLGNKNPMIPDFSQSRINREYNDFQFLGSGSSAEVFRATNIIDLKTYAIKRIPLLDFNTNSLRETRYLSHLEHPNVVKYYGSWIDLNKNNDLLTLNNNPLNKHDNSINNSTISLYIQTELCDQTLKSWMNKRNKLNKKVYREMFFKIVQGMEYMHRNNIIHRDTKPSNILIKDDVPRIADFGLSCYKGKMPITDQLIIKDTGSSITKEIGTELYSSPEQLSGLTDIYSLGIIFFELSCIFKKKYDRIDAIEKLRNNKINWEMYKIPKSDRIIMDKMLNSNSKLRPDCIDIISYMHKKYTYLVK